MATAEAGGGDKRTLGIDVLVVPRQADRSGTSVRQDTNPVERAIRPVALGRKNSLFAGSRGGASRRAIVASLVETAKLDGVEPLAWLRESLTLMIDGHSVSRLEELLPWLRQASRD